jgi:GTPase SAR1 family protein
MESKTMILKVHVSGESSVGKTSLLTRAVQDSFGDGPFGPTIGLDFFLKDCEISNQKVKVQYWDIVGAERFNRFRNPCFKCTHTLT